MISHRHNFIIITPPKTGSTSLTSSLKDCIKMGRLNSWVTRPHLPILTYYRREQVQNYIKYGTVRNPYERMVSWWKMLVNRNPDTNTESFHAFIRTLPKREDAWFFQKNMLGYFSLGGEIKVNKFIRFERLEEDFKSFCDDVGIGKRELLHTNRTNYSNAVGETYYRSFYDEESRKIVEGIFKRDLEYFGYSF